jgi:hypothetical protein
MLTLLLTLLIASASRPSECRRAPTPAECYSCCVSQAPGDVPPRQSERACQAVCRYTPPQPPSESVPR